MSHQILEHNGYKCIYVQKDGTISTVRVIVRAGSAMEIEPLYGIAHFVEHMFFKGSENKSSKEIRDLMGLYGKANAYASYLRTVYYLSCLKEDVGNVLDLLCEVLFQPKYDQAEMDKEANVIVEEIQARSDEPTEYFFDQAMAYTLPGIGHNRAGSKETVLRMDTIALEQFVYYHYLKDRICFVMVTKLAVEEAQAAFAAAIDKWGTGHNDGTSASVEHVPMVAGTKSLEHSSEQAIVSMTYQAFTYAEELEYNFVNEVFTNAFGGGMHSILFDRVREKLGLCYQVCAFELGIGDDCRTFFFTMLQKANVDQALSEIGKCFKEVQEHGIAADLLTTAKKNFLIETASSAETSRGYARSFIDRYFEIGVRSFDDIVSAVNKIQNNDIITYARWLNSTPQQIILMNAF